MSPAVTLLLTIPIVLCALIIIFFGSLTPCLVGVAVLVASIGLAIVQYPEASRQLKTFRTHAKAPNTFAPAALFPAK